VEDERIKEILKKKDEGKKGENGGLGTPATRAQIIEKLKDQGLIELVKGKLLVTEAGRIYYELLPDIIKKPDTTALWWLIQQDILEGKKDPYEIARSVVKVFNSHNDTSYKNIEGFTTAEVVGKCPNCGKDLYKRGKIYTCSSNKLEKQEDGSWKETEGCGFKMFETVFGKKLTTGNVSDLISKGVTSKISGLKTKEGKKFDAKLSLDNKTGRISPVFDKSKAKGKGR
jgi:DNA topoisomerase-3